MLKVSHESVLLLEINIANIARKWLVWKLRTRLLNPGGQPQMQLSSKLSHKLCLPIIDHSPLSLQALPFATHRTSLECRNHTLRNGNLWSGRGGRFRIPLASAFIMVCISGHPWLALELSVTIFKCSPVRSKCPNFKLTSIELSASGSCYP